MGLKLSKEARQARFLTPDEREQLASVRRLRDEGLASDAEYESVRHEIAARHVEAWTERHKVIWSFACVTLALVVGIAAIFGVVVAAILVGRAMLAVARWAWTA